MSDEENVEAIIAGMQFIEDIQPMLDILDSYRSVLINRGFSDELAQQMAADLHKKLLSES